MAHHRPVLRTLILVVLSTTLLTACSIAVDPQAETARLNAFVDEQYLAIMENHPEHLVRTRLDPLNTKWNIETAAQYEKNIADAQATLDLLHREFDPENLTARGRVTYRMWEVTSLDDIQYFKWASSRYPIDQMFGIHSELPNFIINNVQVTSPESAEAYVTRLEGAATKVDQVIQRMEDLEEKGVLPPKFVFPRIVPDAQSVITGLPYDESNGIESPLMADLNKKIGGLDTLEEEVRQKLLTRGEEALRDHIGPAYERLISMLEQQEVRATTDDGAWKLPDGEAYYKSQLKRFTTNSLDAETIHQIGLDEVAKNRRQIQGIMDRVEFEGTVAEFMEFVRTDDQFFYANSDAGRSAYLAKSEAELDRITALLPSLFGVTPKSPLEVRRVEQYRENGGDAFYNAPTADGSRPGIYYVNMRDMKNRNKTELSTLAFHEGLPGHHFAIALSVEREEMPLFRKFSGYSSYGEGWAHYAETLAWEQGLHNEDPYSEFGYFNSQLYRAVRLVVDTGIHHKKWTREEAIAYFMDNSSDSEDGITRQVERYIVWPGQATSYKIGQLKIIELRERARTRLGEHFDIKKFHDKVLGNGSVPLDFLEELIDQWIEEEVASGST